MEGEGVSYYSKRKFRFYSSKRVSPPGDDKNLFSFKEEMMAFSFIERERISFIYFLRDKYGFYPMGIKITSSSQREKNKGFSFPDEFSSKRVNCFSFVVEKKVLCSQTNENLLLREQKEMFLFPE